jgi:hypothetical protein
MKLCPHCSASLEENTVKCRRCGKWVVPVREVGVTRKRRRGNRKRLVVLGGLALFAWAVWAMPEGTLSTRESLELNPDRQTALGIMRNDLETLAATQESYFRTYQAYSGSRSALGFSASDGVAISIIATPTGWSATATHEDHPSAVGCAIYGGSASPPPSPIIPPEPWITACTRGTT